MKQNPAFAQFLVKQGIISADVVIEAVEEELKSIPTVFELVRRSGFVPAERMLDALVVQTSKHCDFETACRELGLWTEGVNQAVKAELDRIRIPLVQRMVEKKRITLDQVNAALDAYLSEGAEPPPVRVDPSLSEPIRAFGEQFTSSVRDFIKLRSAKMDDDANRRELAAVLHRLASTARFAGLRRCESFLGALESVAKRGAVSEIASGIDAVWDLREYILQNGAEDGYAEKNVEGSNRLLQLEKQMTSEQV
jgi:hypothetical protein